MSTATKVKGFFAGVEGDQGSENPPLLPVKVSDGAPPENKWLVHIVEGRVEVRHATQDDHPYISFAVAVDEPAEYEGRMVFGMFFPPREPDADADDRAVASHASQSKRFVGQIDAILGTGTTAGAPGGDLEETLVDLVGLLENSSFVAKIGLERGKKIDPTDTAKDAPRHPDRNRIAYYYPADEWDSPDPEN